jgi:hypothetical protein
MVVFLSHNYMMRKVWKDLTLITIVILHTFIVLLPNFVLIKEVVTNFLYVILK